MKTELNVPRSHREIVEELLSQLTSEEEEEEADLGAQGCSRMSEDVEGEISAANGELIGVNWWFMSYRFQLVCSYLK